MPFYDLDLIPINDPNNTNEVYWISNYFELIEKQIAETYLKDKYPYYSMKCSIINNKIVFHYYTINKFNNKKY